MALFLCGNRLHEHLYDTVRLEAEYTIRSWTTIDKYSDFMSVNKARQANSMDRAGPAAGRWAALWKRRRDVGAPFDRKSRQGVLRTYVQVVLVELG